MTSNSSTLQLGTTRDIAALSSNFHNGSLLLPLLSVNFSLYKNFETRALNLKLENSDTELEFCFQINNLLIKLLYHKCDNYVHKENHECYSRKTQEGHVN